MAFQRNANYRSLKETTCYTVKQSYWATQDNLYNFAPFDNNKVPTPSRIGTLFCIYGTDTVARTDVNIRYICNLRAISLLYHAYGTLHELGESLTAKHAVLQEGKVDELADAFLVGSVQQLLDQG